LRARDGVGAASGFADGNGGGCGDHGTTFHGISSVKPW